MDYIVLIAGRMYLQNLVEFMTLLSFLIQVSSHKHTLKREIRFICHLKLIKREYTTVYFLLSLLTTMSYQTI